LLPWRSVYDNVALGLRIRGYPADEVGGRVDEWIARVGLRGFERYYPSRLSGGMRQRVAIAQTLVYEPGVILMDEPFAHLDVQTRHFIEEDLINLCPDGRRTILFVIHDLAEAITLADSEVFLRARRYSRVRSDDEVAIPEALWGLGLGFVVGAALAWLATRSALVADLLEPVLLLLNAVPRIVLAPIFVMWLGLGAQSKVAVSFFLVFVVIFFAVYAGIREVDRALVERLIILGGSWRDLPLEVYVPSVLSWVFSSLRVAVGFAFTGAIVGEFVGSSAGLGYLMN